MPYEPEQDAARILADDPKGASVEVWLLDDGRFLVLDLIHPAWRGSLRWMLAMRRRRALRMYLPPSEVDKLPGVQDFMLAGKRVFEIGDGFRRYEEWLLQPVEAIEPVEVETTDKPGEGAEEPDEAAKHAAKGLGLLQAGARMALAHVRAVSALVPEKRSPIRTVPYQAPPVCWDEEKPKAGDQKPAKAGKPGKPPR